MSKSLFRLTAMTTSAPKARHKETGTGLTIPPSIHQRFSLFNTGWKTPGIAMEGQTASKTGPSVTHSSLPVFKSQVTVPKGIFKSSMFIFLGMPDLTKNICICFKLIQPSKEKLGLKNAVQFKRLIFKA